MKKQINKITLKTDKIVSLSKVQSQNLIGGMMRKTYPYCESDLCTVTGRSFSC